MKWKVLAGLRFFLASVVLFYHLKDFVPDYGEDLLCKLGKLNGIAAVLGFLLVSGYSIAHSISRKEKGFYKRRILRIYPLYFWAILVALIPFLIVGKKFSILGTEFLQPDFWTVIGNLFFLQTFVVDTIQANTPLWTLGVEVFCYGLAPLFIRLSNKVLTYLICCSSLLYAASPYVYNVFLPQLEFPFYSDWKFGIPLCLLLWTWLLGFLYFRLNQKSYSKILLIGLGCLLLLLNHQHIGKGGIFTYVLSSLIFTNASNIKLPKFLHSIFDYLGDISYPLYLFHIPTFIFSYSVLGIKNSFTLTFLALLVAMLFYHVIDVPLRLRKYKASFFPRFQQVRE